MNSSDRLFLEMSMRSGGSLRPIHLYVVLIDSSNRLLQEFHVVRSDGEVSLIPQRATASPPGPRANEAELVLASARHVVAAVDELDDLTAHRTALPAVVLCHRQ